MKVNKDVKKRLIANLKCWLQDLNNSVKTILKHMRKAETVEEIMQLKKDLLILCLEKLPLEDDHCYFCVLQDYKDISDCKGCLYAKVHGYCENINSDYKKVKIAVGKAIDTIEEKYYFGETYDEQ